MAENDTSDAVMDAPTPMMVDGESKQQQDLSVLEYARLHGISKDYTSEHPLKDNVYVPALDLTGSLEDGPGLIRIEVPQDFGEKEKLSIDKAAAIFLRECLSALDDPLEYDDDSLSRARLTKHLKQELPLLSTDDELDVLHFGHMSIPNFHDIGLPPEYVDIENDEGTSWPRSCMELPATYQSQIESEKLEVPKEALFFLQSSLRDTCTQEDMDSLTSSELIYKRNPALEPVTPPLLPFSPPLSPLVPPSSVMELSLLSEHADSVTREAEELNQRLIEQDQLTSDTMLLDTDEIGKLYSPLKSLADQSSSSSPRKRRADLKIEGPLTPPLLSATPAKKLKTVSFPELLYEYIPTAPATSQRSDPATDPMAAFDEFVKDQIEPLAAPIIKAIENEQLSEADATKRVPVPSIDFSMPIPPWKLYGLPADGQRKGSMTELDAQKRLLSNLSVPSDYQSWHGISKIERQLPWSPFPMELAQIALEESIEDDGSLAELLEGLNLDGVITSEVLIWKPDGLRILDDDCESEEDLEPTIFEEPKAKDLSDLLRRHNTAFAQQEPGSVPVANMLLIQNSAIDGEATKRSAAKAEDQMTLSVAHTDELTTRKPDNSLMFGGLFSASNALSKFLETRNIETYIPQADSVLPVRPATNGHSRSRPTTAVVPVRPEEPATSVPTHRVPPEQTLTAPDIPDDLPPCHFVLSVSVVTGQRLIRAIQKLYPPAEFIERDFRPTSSTTDDADIILSPATGLVLTTLQAIKQRPLPGQINYSGVQERARRVAARYERLLVFISGGAADENDQYRQLDDSDTEAIANLVALARSINTDVQVTYIPGSDNNMAKWIVGAMVRYGINSANDKDQIQLLQDETMWEVFLRRAGMNAFAAQLVLAELKAPEPTNVPQTSSDGNVHDAPQGTFGLPAFVLMTSEERMQRFQGLLGGTSVLKRVNRVLDYSWMRR